MATKRYEYDRKVWRRNVNTFISEFTAKDDNHVFISHVYKSFRRRIFAEVGSRVPFTVDSFGRLLDKRYKRKVAKIRGKVGTVLVKRVCTY
jgi:hypothetical protein